MTEEETETTPQETKGDNVVDKAQKVKEELKEQMDRKEALLVREEALKAEKELGGETEAGEEPKKVEETPHEYRLRVEKELAEGKFDDRE